MRVPSAQSAFMQAWIASVFLGALLCAGCGTPDGCVGGVGICHDKPLPAKYVVIDPSGSQAGLAKQQARDVQSIARRGPAQISIVLLGVRPGTSVIIEHADIPTIDRSDPNQLDSYDKLLDALGKVVADALAARTHSSDLWGALDLVHDDASQRELEPGYEVYVLGDSEPCVPGVCWTNRVPESSGAAIAEVQKTYGRLDFAGEDIRFVVGTSAYAKLKPPGYLGMLKTAVVAVCRWAGAYDCTPTSAIAEVRP